MGKPDFLIRVRGVVTQIELITVSKAYPRQPAPAIDDAQDDPRQVAANWYPARPCAGATCVSWV